MSVDIRIVSIAAVAAAFLSALTGILSRVAFGAVVLRSVLSGLGFAALAIGASFIIKKFLPEILSEASSGESVSVLSSALPSQEPVPEHRVDVVLPGEGEEQPSDVEPLPPSSEPSNVGEAELRDFEREAEEIGADSLVPQGESGNPEPTPAPARPPASFDDLDVLPDLDGMSDVFSTAAHETVDAGGTPARDPISTTGASRDGVDAVAMAQAVRTLIKRDQKG